MLNHINFKTKASIFILWLFTISCIIGIASPAKDWFLSFTPLNLLLSLIVALWNFKLFNTKVIFALTIPFILGFVAEALGVNYGLIFGNYIYGENLGFKIFGVPLMMCINWTLLTITTAEIVKSFSKNIVIASLIAAALMTGLDVIIEVSAPSFDFWEFENGIVPLQNYLGWFVTAFIAHLGYQSFKVESSKVISWHILISVFIFFSVFLLIK